MRYEPQGDLNNRLGLEDLAVHISLLNNSSIASTDVGRKATRSPSTVQLFSHSPDYLSIFNNLQQNMQ